MRTKRSVIKALAVFLALLLGAPQGVLAQGEGEEKPFKQEELDQLLAPLALYPDSLLAQILMASTYPLEVVQAARWAKANQNLKGDALTKALEEQDWDPSVRSLVNFPQVLEMMNEKLEWTQKLGDAFLAQQKDVMDTVQKLRTKAYGEGNLQTTEQQKVVVEEETKAIIIEPAKPEVVYVPTYNPSVVYGTWPYAAYPPYSYYPPGWVPGAALFSFGMGVAIGAAWGYAWGGCGWGRGEVNINTSRNTNINNNIDRSKHQNKVTSGQGGRGEWKHNPEHRKGASYRDQNTANKFDRGASRDAQSREAFRGRADSGRQDLARGSGDEFRDRGSGGRQDGSRGGRDQVGDRSAGGRQDFGGGRDAGSFDRDRGGGGSQQRRDSSAFGGADRGGQTRDFSSRGNSSLSSSRGSGGGGSSVSRGGGGGGGGRGGGGGGGGGGGRGGGGGGRGGGGRR